MPWEIRVTKRHWRCVRNAPGLQAGVCERTTIDRWAIMTYTQECVCLLWWKLCCVGVRTRESCHRRPVVMVTVCIFYWRGVWNHLWLRHIWKIDILSSHTGACSKQTGFSCYADFSQSALWSTNTQRKTGLAHHHVTSALPSFQIITVERLSGRVRTNRMRRTEKLCRDFVLTLMNTKPESPIEILIPLQLINYFSMSFLCISECLRYNHEHGRRSLACRQTQRHLMCQSCQMLWSKVTLPCSDFRLGFSRLTGLTGIQDLVAIHWPVTLCTWIITPGGHVTTCISKIATSLSPSDGMGYDHRRWIFSDC